MGPHHRAHVLAFLAAIMLAGTTLANSASAQVSPTKRAAATTALRRLTRLGYRHVRMACTRRTTRIVCRWQGDRNRVRCTGVATAIHRGRALPSIAIRRQTCRGLAGTTSTREGKQRVIAPPVPASPTPKPPAIVQPAPGGSSTGGRAAGTGPLSNPQLGFNTYTTSRTVAEQRELGRHGQPPVRRLGAGRALARTVGLAADRQRVFGDGGSRTEAARGRLHGALLGPAEYRLQQSRVYRAAGSSV